VQNIAKYGSKNYTANLPSQLNIMTMNISGTLTLLFENNNICIPGTAWDAKKRDLNT